jgi:hypothetical protein
MRHVFFLTALAAIAITAIAVTRPADAAYHLIRWQDSGFCQIWDESFPTVPYPSNYTVIQGSMAPTFGDALAVKDGMLRNGNCAF